MGEMLPRAQLIGPRVRSVLGGPMEEVSLRETLARGEESSLLMLEAGVDNVCPEQGDTTLDVGGRRGLVSRPDGHDVQ